MKHIYIFLAVLVSSILVSLTYMLLGSSEEGTASESKEFVEEVVAVETPTPKAMVEEEEQSAYELKRIGGAAVLYPRVPLMDMNFRPKRYDIQPGAYFPGLEGVKLEELIHIVATTFPMLNVRAIPDGFPLDLEVRRDRVTVIIDPATNYVLDARIG